MTHPTYRAADVPAWPAYALTVHDDGRVDAAGPLVPFTTHPHRAAAVGAVAEASARLGRPVRAEATEANGTVWLLVVSPDGSVGEIAGARATERPRRRGTRATKASPPASAVSSASAATAASSVSSAAPADAEPDFAEGLALVAEHLEAGRIDPAAELAARLDRRAADTLGVSHPDALRIREVWARISALLGDTAAGVRLFRDVAERWHYRGETENAESAAARAVALWLQITDLDTALATGMGVVRMRNQIPGEGATALTEALKHQAWLENTRAATGQGAAPEAAQGVAPEVAATPVAGSGPVVGAVPEGTPFVTAEAVPAAAPADRTGDTGVHQEPTALPVRGVEPVAAAAHRPAREGSPVAPTPSALVEPVLPDPSRTPDGSVDPGGLPVAGDFPDPGGSVDPVGGGPVPVGAPVPGGSPVPGNFPDPGGSPVPGGSVDQVAVPAPAVPAWLETAHPGGDGSPAWARTVDTAPAWLGNTQPRHGDDTAQADHPGADASSVATEPVPAWLDAAGPADAPASAGTPVQQVPGPRTAVRQAPVQEAATAPQSPVREPPRVARPAFSWDRPARDSRTAG